MAGMIGIREGVLFLQANRSLWDERLRLLGALRYDKNMNFQGQFTPRVGFILALDKDKNHNIRSSYQAGFRMPTLPAQYLDLNLGTFRFVGGLPVFDERYGLIDNNYTRESVLQFLDSLRVQTRGTTNPADYAHLLQRLPLGNFRPEKVRVLEIGSRHLLFNALYVDIDYSYSRFTDFLGQIDLVDPRLWTQPEGTFYMGRLTPDSAARGAFASYRRFYNTSTPVYTHHLAIAVQYTINRHLFLSTNFTYADIILSEQAKLDKLLAPFNTPRYKASATLMGRELLSSRRLGFVLSYRWMNAYFFQEIFHAQVIPTYQLFDLQLSYKLPALKAQIRLGGQNILNNRHIEVPGGPMIGALYYLQFIYDPFMP